MYQVGLFYLYFVFYELYQYCKRGHKKCCKNFESENVIHLINIGIYILQMAITFFAYIQFPAETTVDGDKYINYKSYAEMTVLARYLNAINSLFVWFEVILYMSLVPAFALVLGESTFLLPFCKCPRSLFVDFDVYALLPLIDTFTTVNGNFHHTNNANFTHSLFVMVVSPDRNYDPLWGTNRGLLVGVCDHHVSMLSFTNESCLLHYVSS